MTKLLNKICLGLAIIVLLLPTFTRAEISALPEMLSGVTFLEDQNGTYYGGNMGNYAVFSKQENNFNIGYDYTSQNGLLKCQDSIPNAVQFGYCFILVTGFPPDSFKNYTATTIKSMVSRTTINNGLVDLPTSYELPALFLDPRTIVGDAYFGSNTDLSNFALWGRNLAQGDGSIDPTKGASWMGNDYDINPESQSYWNSVNGGVEFDQYLDKVANLKNDAATVTSTQLNTATWYLQASGTDFTSDSTMGDAAKYPDGKVWYFKGNINITSNITYYGIGTIIIDGNIVVKKDKSIKAGNANSKLGIIVLEQ